VGCPNRLLPCITVRIPELCYNWTERRELTGYYRGTAVSIVKLVTLAQAFTAKGNFLYGSVDGSILSGAESAPCMIVGSLPPLRKPFDKFLKMILPDRLMERTPPNPSFVNAVFSTKGLKVTSVDTGDADSAIFHIEGERIVRTTQVKW
jgi:hypothetical protein